MRFCGKIRILWKNGNFIWKCEFFGEMHIFRKNANFILKCKFRGQMLILFLSVNLTEKFEFFFELPSGSLSRALSRAKTFQSI